MEIIIFTNEHYIDILNITLPRFVEYLKPLNLRINVVTNRLVNNTGINFDGVNIIETGVGFEYDGSHFRQSMLHALSELNCEYFLFFCDDYILNSMTKKESFENVFNIIKEFNCDYYSFSCLRFTGVTHKWKTLNPNLKDYGIDNGILYQIDDDYRHLYSVQPCIWKTSSFIELTNYNSRLSLHGLDNTMILNKKGRQRNLNYETNYYDSNDENKLDYNFVNLAIDLPPFSYNLDNREMGSDYFVFDYGEIVRHGKIMETITNSRLLVLSILEKNPELKDKIKKFL
jgi:hypothetical protein